MVLQTRCWSKYLLRHLLADAGPGSQLPVTMSTSDPAQTQGLVVIPGVQLPAVVNGMPQTNPPGFGSAAAGFAPIPQPLPQAGMAAQTQLSPGKSSHCPVFRCDQPRHLDCEIKSAVHRWLGLMLVLACRRKLATRCTATVALVNVWRLLQYHLERRCKGMNRCAMRAGAGLFDLNDTQSAPRIDRRIVPPWLTGHPITNGISGQPSPATVAATETPASAPVSAAGDAGACCIPGCACALPCEQVRQQDYGSGPGSRHMSLA